MIKDPIVEEIRSVRRQLEKEFCNDPNKLLQYIYKRQKRNSDKLISGVPRNLLKVKVA